MSVEKLLSPKQLADLSTLAESTLANWRKAGKGPRYVQLGRRIGYPVSAVETWMQENAK